ncbi:hypothetical protein JTB14_011922 [Gonioctena quinquepunctata]|nr:hypothetical protein JTB14_011922 [Gonioctena quinquepunctata]
MPTTSHPRPHQAIDKNAVLPSFYNSPGDYRIHAKSIASELQEALEIQESQGVDTSQKHFLYPPQKCRPNCWGKPYQD